MASIRTRILKRLHFFNFQSQEVTAIYPYKGNSDERELSFEFGDIVKIINIIEKDPQWAWAELKGVKGYIALNYFKPKSETMS